MPLVMGQLLSAWRELERMLVDLPESDPRAGVCRELVDDMRATYQRLVDVYPRPQEDTELVLRLIERARGLTQGTEGEAELEPA